jgi:hypothetical protein
MHTLLDTNVLLRSSQPSSPHHFIATAAVNALLDANPNIAPINLI